MTMYSNQDGRSADQIAADVVADLSDFLSPNEPDYCKLPADADEREYEIHQHSLGIFDLKTGEWRTSGDEPHCVLIRAGAWIS